MVKLHTSLGEITIELDEAKAPVYSGRRRGYAGQ